MFIDKIKNIKHNNKGFTLIEMIVAIIISTSVTASLIILTNLFFQNFVNAQTESQSQIECQFIESSLKDDISSSDTIKYFNFNDIKAIKLKSSTDNKFKYYVLKEKRVFLIETDIDTDDISDLIYDEKNIIAEQINDIKLEEISDAKYSVKIIAGIGKKRLQKEFVVYRYS